MKFKLLLPLFSFVPLLLYSNIDSGGGKSSINQLSNHSSIGSYIASTSTSVGSNANKTGFLNVVFLPYAFSEVNLDQDGDGMLDEWEAQHGLLTSVDDSGSDYDGDQMTALEEFIAGTDPTDPSSHLNLFIEMLEDAMRISFDTNPSRTYELRVTQDFSTYHSYATITGDGQTYELILDPFSDVSLQGFNFDQDNKFFFRLVVRKID
jgi:hypothetical protein